MLLRRHKNKQIQSEPKAEPKAEPKIIKKPKK